MTSARPGLRWWSRPGSGVGACTPDARAGGGSYTEHLGDAGVATVTRLAGQLRADFPASVLAFRRHRTQQVPSTGRGHASALEPDTAPARHFGPNAARLQCVDTAPAQRVDTVVEHPGDPGRGAFGDGAAPDYVRKWLVLGCVGSPDGLSTRPLSFSCA
ncbi:hypothetical protein I546_0270 [Mycobacterium kansasii 732]|nr:hypothetical protein I546_0270 [Mycobacterium kansasii 732]